ncbi:phosphoribosyl-AMP cyclohydrolase [Pelistega sp. NLN82]|uniref:Phosphoribosyl-AMP cyclohydrolase n=1 Tax=Pelistega ratti TaxID=2652177 RepID=A0A6L9Y7V5_9BURK|nr:phosphoribosyl-AMP cyclohydrolase [Pelistega ratti]NEN76456.1 phosphoribosyl-AMP cyclohydrolase [Pelistega ratti]
MSAWVKKVHFDDNGLIPVVVQDYQTNRLLMMAWMNHEALLETVKNRIGVYWSRSRKKLWRKGEESGHTQIVHEIRLDCDQDVILLKVEQVGGIACHTGRENCFYLRLDTVEGTDELQWNEVDPVLKDPETIYQQSHE